MECDVYADVDFGRGPVEVRCTEKGQHMVHQCSVILERSPAQSQSVFDPKETVEELREVLRKGRG